MILKRLLSISLAINLVTLVLVGINLYATNIREVSAEPVIYECNCPVEETTEPVVETTEVEVTEEVTEATEVIEETTPETESVNSNHLGEFKLTAYCACVQCCGKSDGITATGTIATQGRTIAVDPQKIPYGTKVSINGHTYVAEDCGGAIKGNRIDVYFDSHSEALQFGVQYADVYIVGS